MKNKEETFKICPQCFKIMIQKEEYDECPKCGCRQMKFGNGWTHLEETIAYVSSNTFTILGDITEKYN